MKVDFLTELENWGIEHEIKDGYVIVKCPFHADTKPSGNISLEHGGFKCFSCDTKSDFYKYIGAVQKKSPSLIRLELEERYGIVTDKTIDIDLVEMYHTALKENLFLKKALRERCIGDAVIRERRLGANNGRVIIPIYNASGYVVNLRKHRPGGADGQKVINQRGHAKPTRLYPIDQLKYDVIALCGGELKAIAAAHVLNKSGIGAISNTAGELNWDPKLSDFLRNKTVYILYDIDEPGQKGAHKVAYSLYNVVKEVYIVELPLDKDKYPTGDVNDFLAEKGNLKELIQAQNTPWVPVHKRHTLNGDTTDVHISKAMNAEFTGRRLRTKCNLVAISEHPYTIPSSMTVSCTRDTEVCAVCPILNDAEGEIYDIHPEDPSLLAMVDSTETARNEAMKRALDIPPKCRVCILTPQKFFHVEDVRLSPQLEISNREVQREMIAAYMFQSDLVLNETYTVEGRLHPHPQTQNASLIISESEIADDALSLYENKNPHELNVFKPKEWTVDSLQAKLDEIYSDFAVNVTGIYKRQPMHLAIDLAYHSVLFFDFKGRQHKGWSEVIIVGDSAQGKSDATMMMMRHYKLGEKIDCKNATVAGVLGGLQQMGKKWFVSWGIIPTHDKRLVVLEELKGMHQEVFAKLTDMRSSGIAEIPKIEKRRTQARTRLVALSNPRGQRAMSSYSFGIRAFLDLIPNPEDVRRFDMGLIVSEDEIDQATIHKLIKAKKDVEHFYTSDLCNRLVLWAWTTDKVKFEDPDYIMDSARELSEIFHPSIPLVDTGSMHIKLARLSCALAARTYSTEDYKTLIVRKCHVDYMKKFLVDTYCSPNCRYDEFSKTKFEAAVLNDAEGVKALVNATPRPTILGNFMVQQGTFDEQDIVNWTGLDRENAAELIGHFICQRAIKRMGGGGGRPRYHLEAGMIKLLEEMATNKEFKVAPDYGDKYS